MGKHTNKQFLNGSKKRIWNGRYYTILVWKFINQIAKRLNAGGPAYQADMEEILERLEQIWQLQRRILLSQR